jgi:hypothetical protein
MKVGKGAVEVGNVVGNFALKSLLGEKPEPSHER